MPGAALIDMMVMQRPLIAILPIAFVAGLMAFWLSRREP